MDSTLRNFVEYRKLNVVLLCYYYLVPGGDKTWTCLDTTLSSFHWTQTAARAKLRLPSWGTLFPILQWMDFGPSPFYLPEVYRERTSPKSIHCKMEKEIAYYWCLRHTGSFDCWQWVYDDRPSISLTGDSLLVTEPYSKRVPSMLGAWCILTSAFESVRIDKEDILNTMASD